jgi:PAS domain S-box-containing protein
MTVLDTHDPTLIEAVQWRQIVNGAMDTAIISTDSQGRVSSWNTGAESILGWQEAEMLGRSLEVIFPEEDGAHRQLQIEMQDAVRLGRGGGEEGWRVKKNGTRFWAVGELSPIKENGELLGFLKILRDRTEQRRGEEQVAEERQALEIVNRTISTLAVEVDRQRLLQIVADAAVELSGASFGAFLQNGIADGHGALTPYALSGATSEAAAAIAQLRKNPIFTATFDARFLVRSDDTTQDERFRQKGDGEDAPSAGPGLRSYLAVPVWRHGKVLGSLILGHPNPAVFSDRTEQRLVGLAAEAAVAFDNAMLAHELKIFNATLEQQVVERTEQLRINEAALRQAQKMEAVGQLTGGVAHDFNNLLQVILGNLDILRRMQPHDPRLTRAADSAIASAKRAAALTQRLLAFSRRQPLDPKPVDSNALVSGMSDLLRRTLGETIELQTIRGAGLWLIEVDSNELEAAILNLAVNARDAMPEGGRLTIETANVELDQAYAAAHAEVIPGQYVCLSITDTGTGMSESTLQQAFEPFFTTKPVGQGTGLGLSQVYGFVKQSGGHVKIISELGHGTTVKICLSRFERAEIPAPTTAPAKLPEGNHGETILVTEDDDDVRAYAVNVLQDLGYRVLESHDGPFALRLLERHEVHLLFTDVVLRGKMSGAQLAAQAKALHPELKVLFTTGYARDAIVHHGRLDPGVELLTKPYSAEELSTRLRDMLDGSLPRRPAYSR